MNSTLKRSISGVIFLAVMLGGLLYNEELYLILFGLIIGYGMLREFYKMTLGEDYDFLQACARVSGIVLFWQAYKCFSGSRPLRYLVLVVLLLVLLLMIVSIFHKDHKQFLKTGYIYAGFLYIALPVALSNAVVIRGGEYSGLLMVAFFCIIWASDVGAYCFGMLFGQKLWPAKMCPSISPNKSWAGFLGGLVTALLAGAILHWTGLFAFPMYHCLIVAALMHVTGVLGDLFESLWKRAVGVKDSGNLIPGHGGLLDRFDSALFAIPAGFVYLLIFHLV